jgi:hypothetical protein
MLRSKLQTTVTGGFFISQENERRGSIRNVQPEKQVLNWQLMVSA